MNPAIPERFQEYLSTFELFSDRQDRIQFLISIAERYTLPPAEIIADPFSEDHRVKGCESEVFAWVVNHQDGTFSPYYGVKNPQAVSAMALAVILQDSLSHAEGKSFQAITEDMIYSIFGRELSMGKSMGLTGMLSAIQADTKK